MKGEGLVFDVEENPDEASSNAEINPETRGFCNSHTLGLNWLGCESFALLMYWHGVTRLWIIGRFVSYR